MSEDPNARAGTGDVLPSPRPAARPTAIRDRPKVRPTLGNGKREEVVTDEPVSKKVTVRRKVTVRMVVWVLFGVICALLPFAAVSLKNVLSATPTTLDELLVGGELYVVSAVLAGGALGELIGAAYRRERSLVVVLAGFGCFATFAGNVMGYMVVGTSNPEMIVSVSEWLFLLTLIASGVSIGRAAAE
jgi:hypothetical protein